MMNKILGGVLAIGLLVGIAHAATDQAAPPPPPAQDQASAGQKDDQGGWFGGWGHHGGRRHEMRGEMGGPGGPRGFGGPGGMMMNQQGFRLQLGPTTSVGIMCGTQAMKDCIAEAQPLIDAAKAAAGTAAK